MKWSVIEKALPLFADAFWTTLWLSAVGIALALVIGAVAALVREFEVPVAAKAAATYEELLRNTPLLIHLFFLYYALPVVGIKLPAQACAIVGLALMGGAYMAGAFRGGFSGIPSIQQESARALGLTRLQRARYVTLPQGLGLSVPAVAANMIFLVKETSIFTVIAVPELTNTARYLIGMYYRTDEYLFMLVVAYAVILVPLSIGLTLLERRVRRGSFGH
ncbi:amino acid ABC transporter permease [Pseudoclavibacter sp. 13-3]|uniref:amino acid ABC transporter permease n=1 Tax=Pseudoclavibacter sp. 13-3 TaxID=2901228 RepID=UPI001E360A82|nr:amino acid ABC transporter permease [Pseudoclavibacter sp. 13-3]